MGSIWIPELDDWLIEAGLEVITWPGWLTRSRSSGGYEDILGIGIHHDASSVTSDWQDSCRRMWETNAYRPIGALYLRRDGAWVVGAAGATNTQGKGGPYPTSRRMTPLNDANRYWIAIEADNNGTGEPWPKAQLDSYVKGCAAIVRGLARDKAIVIDPLRDVVAHFEWAPDRKIDPAGPPAPYARLSDQYLRWDMKKFRSDVAAQLQEKEPPMATLSKPVRVLDTRVKKQPLAPMIPRRVGILPTPPAWAGAVRVNLTAVDGAADGWLSIDGGATSKVNYMPGQEIANEISVPLENDGTWFIEVTSLVRCDIIVDVSGWDSIVN